MRRLERAPHQSVAVDERLLLGDERGVERGHGRRTARRAPSPSARRRGRTAPPPCAHRWRPPAAGRSATGGRGLSSCRRPAFARATPSPRHAPTGTARRGRTRRRAKRRVRRVVGDVVLRLRLPLLPDADQRAHDPWWRGPLASASQRPLDVRAARRRGRRRGRRAARGDGGRRDMSCSNMLRCCRINSCSRSAWRAAMSCTAETTARETVSPASRVAPPARSPRADAPARQARSSRGWPSRSARTGPARHVVHGALPHRESSTIDHRCHRRGRAARQSSATRHAYSTPLRKRSLSFSCSSVRTRTDLPRIASTSPWRRSRSARHSASCGKRTARTASANG